MAFRDEGEALRAKCEALRGDKEELQKELESTRRERNRFRRQAERLETQLRTRVRCRAPVAPIPSTGAAFVVAGGLVGWLAVASLIVLSAWTGPRTCPRSSHWQPAMAEAQSPSTERATACWSAEVVDVSGRQDLQLGDNCSIEATLHRGAVNERILRWKVDVRCSTLSEDLAVFNSIETFHGLDSRYAELGVVHLDDGRSFPALLVEDFGARLGQPELSLDTGLGRAWIDHGARSQGGWSVRLGVDPEPRPSSCQLD